MLALKCYEQNEGFSVIGADELFFINGGSVSLPSYHAPTPSNGVSLGSGGVVITDGNTTVKAGIGGVSVSVSK